MNTQQFKNNGHSKFPLSTDTLDFMQEQTLFLQQLTAAIGQNVIIKQSTDTTDGLIIFDGELMPLRGNPALHISINSTYEDIEALSETYQNARIRRYATYVSRIGVAGTTKLASAFYNLQNKSLKDTNVFIDTLRQHAVPKGTIVMWSGSINAIPAGWLLCDGQAGTPDLRGRFIVGYAEESNDYDTIGKTGGKASVLLTGSQSGLPAHSHKIQEDGAHSHSVTLKKGGNGTTVLHQNYTGAAESNAGALTTSSAGVHTHNITIAGPTNAQAAHENRPPFYTLAFIIKTTDVPTL
ncbi:MAG: tail fiber protein [Paludibacter sp.]|nr:tail fiber protein [Bacteroidales bacterium]MCM1068821.1 tail fiber protein [Prevotella sp.]MCM1353082.1 tail fiber protein [Bacteroides sp.]MCM1442404.1 tail fiber protein [Muribaculum sp.]MCM1481247.1 tail fiber protein [Paludibacter sp.]